MLKIPEPPKEVNLRIRIPASLKQELEQYVKYLKAQQPHSNTHNVVETMIKKAIPRAGRSAKMFNEFKQKDI